MIPFVKICGICSKSDLEQILFFKPDALGFVIWPKSKRHIDPAQIGEWSELIPPDVKKVGVFVDPTAAELSHAVTAGKLDVVQIHKRNPDYVPEVPPNLNIEVWGAFQPHELDLSDLRFQISDFILLDAFDAETVGGTGKTCDWAKARTVVETCGKPVLLAGGLTVENVSEAIRKVQPWGIDVSSSLEREPGRKNIEKVRQFIEAARTA
jgi:phosphoribosylanthranilate isomerase